MSFLRQRRVTLPKGATEVQDLAAQRANHRMQREIIPYLDGHVNPKLWFPLVPASNESAYGMKLRMPDPLAMQIMRDKKLMKMVERIVEEETGNAAIIKAEAFVTSIIDQLIHG